ncbi:MAG: GldG family protein [Brevinematales bacterium]|nr:GldG family protein [Brevinematales bacterium]
MKRKILIVGTLALILFLTHWISWILWGTKSLIFSVLVITEILLAVTSLFLFKEVWISWLKRGRTLTGIQKSVECVLVLGVMVVLYLLTQQNQARLDLTAQGLYRLSPETLSLLSSLTNELKIICFRPDAASGPAIEYQENLLKTYKAKSKHISLQFVDPIKNPVLASEYKLTEEISTIFELSGNRVAVSIRDVMDQDAQTGRMNYRGEEAFTSAIKSLLESDVRKAYVLAGHGEFSPNTTSYQGYSDFFNALSQDMIEWKSLDLTKFVEIPQHTSLLIIGRPTHTFSVDELDTLKDYIDRGGNLLVFVEHDSSYLLNDVLKEFGIYFEPNIVIEEENYIPQLGNTVFSPRLIPHTITDPLIKRKLPVVVGAAMGLVSVRETNKGNLFLEITPLLLSSRTSYAERSLESIRKRKAIKDKNDWGGPLPLGFAVVRKKLQIFRSLEGALTNTVESRLVVFGDADMANNAYIAQWANKDLLLNAVNFLVKRERKITLRPKTPLIAEYNLTSTDQAILISVAIFLVLGYTITGIIVIFNRRKRVKG